VIGETTLDMDPGAKIWIAAGSCPGIVVCVNVARGVGLRVGNGQVDLDIYRHERDVEINVVNRRGDVQVIVTK